MMTSYKALCAPPPFGDKGVTHVTGVPLPRRTDILPSLPETDTVTPLGVPPLKMRVIETSPLVGNMVARMVEVL